VWARAGATTNYNAGTAQRSAAITTPGTAVPSIEAEGTGLSNLKVGVAVSGASVTYTVTNGTYAATISPANFSLSGLPGGLTAAAAGYTVTLTDYEEMILDVERINAAASKLTNVRFALLDWLKPPEMERYDIILGAEILFREEFFEPLLGVLRKALKPDGVVYLAHDVRRRSVEPFLKMAEREYRIAVSQRKLKNLDQDKTILLTRLQPRH
jgi:SAM-dependent methyltransferase